MILVVDIGNTNTVLGAYQGKELVASWRLSTDRDKTSDEYAMILNSLLEHRGIGPRQIEAVVISCVVPPLITAFEGMSRRYLGCEPILVGPGVRTGLVVRYENPKEVGADRIVNAVAAYHKHGGPLIVVDFGTATTFCAISSRAEYLGGSIAPGVGIASEALFQRAAKLPRVELVKPRSVVGRNTVSSMQSGIIFGYAGLVDGIVTRMKQEMEPNPMVIATGGLAEVICPECSTIDRIEPYLTLEGLLLIYEMNASGVDSNDRACGVDRSRAEGANPAGG